MLLKLLRTYLRPYGANIVAIVLLQFGATVAALYLPTLNARIIDDGVAQGDIPTIWSLGAAMLGVTLGQIVCQAGAIYFGARTAMGFGRDVRAAIFSRVLSFSTREVNTFGAPSLITRNTNDVQQVQMLVLMGLTMMIAAPLTAIGGVIMALRTDVQLSALLLVIIPVMAIVIGMEGPE